jgi:hypothetical protein
MNQPPAALAASHPSLIQAHSWHAQSELHALLAQSLAEPPRRKAVSFAA